MSALCSPALDQRTATDHMATAVRSAPVDSDTAAIHAGVGAVLAAHPDGAVIDSHVVASALVERRTARRENTRSIDWTQTKDYLQFRLRETTHVCGHAIDGHHYLVHPEPVCSESCKSRTTHHRAPAPKRALCPSCFMQLPVDGPCGTCE